FATSRSVSSTAPELDLVDLTILAGWAEAVAEAMAHAPDGAEALLAEASSDAPWRSKFELPEPSPQLDEAIEYMGRIVRVATSRSGAAAIDSLLDDLRRDRHGEERLHSLVHRTMLSALEQRRTRQAPMPESPPRATNDS